MTRDEALEAINALRSNVVGTQSATWSNTMYPLVAILDAAGYAYAEPTDEQMRQHLAAYGGAGGYPGNELRDPPPYPSEPEIVRRDALRLCEALISYSNLREKVRLRDDPDEYAEAERLIARYETLKARAARAT